MVEVIAAERGDSLHPIFTIWGPFYGAITTPAMRMLVRKVLSPWVFERKSAKEARANNAGVGAIADIPCSTTGPHRRTLCNDTTLAGVDTWLR
jgi:hypothetical protein